MRRRRRIPTRSLAPSRRTTRRDRPGASRQNSLGLDRIKIRLSVLGLLIVMAFVALFSRLWFLQVLASDEYQVLARENRMRRVESEPPRGLILDRNGKPLVDNRSSLSVAIDLQVVDAERLRRVLRRLSVLLDTPVKELRRRLREGTSSPFKPVPVANDVPERVAIAIGANKERFPGVSIEDLPVREYPNEDLLAHVLGYVGEISEQELEDDPLFDGAKPPYRPGDIVGKSGVERTYDRYLRGKPRVELVVVNSLNRVVGRRVAQEERPGNNLYLSVDLRLQRIVERALEDGIMTARASGYPAPDGGAVVLDPRTGYVLAMASYPDYDPSMLADGITQDELDSLGMATPEDNQDDALVNRAIRAEQAPGSTFKVVTAGAAMWTGILDPYGGRNCTASATFPPGGGPGSVTQYNWTSAVPGYIGIPESLEISCNTFYYQLGWELEEAYGHALGDGSEKFQDYMFRTGLGEPTGVDLPYESDGVVPGWKWCRENRELGFCYPFGRDAGQIWLPGWTVNMAIGQGDIKVTPLQMAVVYAAIANGGTVWQPRIGYEVRRPVATSEQEDVADEGVAGKVVRRIRPRRAARLPLTDEELAVIRQGLEQVISGSNGTAHSVFAGFPLDRFPLAGKTGTAQRGESTQTDSWFVSFGPTDDPRYVVSVYVEEAGHGGTTSAPIAREIWEGIAALNGIRGVGGQETDVSLETDYSG